MSGRYKLLGVFLVVSTSVWALTETSVDYNNFKVETSPKAVLMTLAQGPDTRAFAWQTDTTVSESKVWLVKGASATDADFDKATPTVGTTKAVTKPNLNYHHVRLTGLEPGVTYSYRLGGNGHYAYGTFTCKAPGETVTIVNLNDAQTREAAKLYMWENTASRAATLVGAENIDFVLTGGDICDENKFDGINNATYGGTAAFNGSQFGQEGRVTLNFIKWAFGVEAGTPHFPGIPWVMASGNHDYYLYGDTTATDYVDYKTSGSYNNADNKSGASVGCHSFDYGDVHVATLPYQTWGQPFRDALAWLDRDLKAAARARWKVVALHWGPYTTGDHCDDTNTKDLVAAMAPICSSNHVDIVLQAHDHTYSKSLPYRWDTCGYTTTLPNAQIVNATPETKVVDGVTYDYNPKGTYYVSCGCAGHRVGEDADVAAKSTAAASYANARTYKLATGMIALDSTAGGRAFHAGDDASFSVNASMFGVLSFTGDTMTYDFYTVETDGQSAPVHFDTLKVMKGDSFRVTPYLQHPTENAMTVKWFTEGDAPATISWWTDGEAAQSLTTTPDEATELYYSDTDISSYNSRTGYSGIERGPIQTIPWHHRARLTGLKAGTTYHYRVDLAGGVSYENTFRTVPDRNTPVRFLCYSDSETEPESTGKFEDWEKPPQGSSFHPNKYFVDSTVGYASNIVHMIKRNPDFYLIAGDLVQYGYEQRDWDEFWRHNAGVRNDPAGSAPIFAAPGNHDYVSSGINGDNRANYDGGEAAISRYLKYFEYPSNGVDFGDGGPDRSQLFYRQDYGRVTVVSIDTNNGDDSDPDKDSCTVLYRDASKVPAEYKPTAGQAPCRAPDFNPGTPQFNWLTNQLADAQAKGQFIFVLNHHMPHSVGYHNRHNHYSSRSYSDGTYEPYSAVAVRVLQPYLLKYGVTAWICGHDEINEHSVVYGTETLPDGSTRSASLNIFDVGNSGDGLRGGGANGENMRGEGNMYEHWRAHVDAPEIYDTNGVLTEGGKHYGHLEINVEPDGDSGDWKCTMTPVHVFVNKVNGEAATFERREYDNVTTVVKSRPALPEGYRYDSDGNVECRVTVTPGAGGGVKVNGQSATDEVWALQGATVTLTAENSGMTVFDRWTGDTSTIVSGFANSPEIKVVLSAPLALTATWTTTKYRYWNPTTQTQNGENKYYYWTTAANWRDAAGATGAPATGDTVIFGSDSKGSGAYRVSNDSSANPLYEVCFSNKTTVSVNQGSFALKAGGKGLQYLRNASNTGNWSGIRLCGDGEVPVNIANNVTYAMQKSCLLGSGNPTVVKTGPGVFVNCNQSGNYNYTAPRTLLRQGTWDITLKNVLNGCVIGFDGNDGSQVLQFCYGSYSEPLQIKDGGIFETNGVANTTHAISANGKDQQVIFTGTPKFNPMVFSGRLIKGAGVKWSPSAADHTFVFSNAVSDTSGRILIDKGTVRLTCGASMTNLTEVSVAQTAVFEVEEGAGANFKAKALTLGGAEARLNLGTGVALAFDAATLAGTALAAKTYSATGANGTQRVAWIEGEGSVTVATGPANADVWSGLGANNYTPTDGNWLNGVAPDVTEGGLLATFANGGSEAKLPANVAAKFAGLVLSPAFGDSSFTFSTDGGTASLAQNGINSVAASTPVVWSMGWPLEVATAQTWDFTANNTFKVEAPVSGSSALSVTGAGAIEFNCTSTHSGTKDLSVANVKIAADNALGTASGAVTFHHVKTKLTFAGDITLDPSFYSPDQNESFTSCVAFEPNSHVTFNGNFGVLSEIGINFGAGSVTTFRGGLKFVTDGMKGRVNAYGSGTVVITNKNLSTCRAFYGQAGHPITLELQVAGNVLNDYSYWARFPSGRLVTRVPNAFDISDVGLRPIRIHFDDSTFDLAGNNQQLDLIDTTAKTRIESATPAVLTLSSATTGDCQEGTNFGGANRTDLAVYAGQVSFLKKGDQPHVFGATSTSTGAVAVTKGVVTMNAGGKWPNATEVRVAGGAVKLQNAEAFGTNAVWRVTAGAAPVVQLDFAGTNTAARLYVGGERQSGGTWGAVGSGAEHEAAWISGSGVLNVTRRGFSLTVR